MSLITVQFYTDETCSGTSSDTESMGFPDLWRLLPSPVPTWDCDSSGCCHGRHEEGDQFVAEGTNVCTFVGYREGAVTCSGESQIMSIMDGLVLCYEAGTGYPEGWHFRLSDCEAAPLPPPPPPPPPPTTQPEGMSLITVQFYTDETCSGTSSDTESMGFPDLWRLLPSPVPTWDCDSS